VLVGLYRLQEPGWEHGYLLIMHYGDKDKILDHKVSSAAEVSVLRYHICKKDGEYFLYPERVNVTLQDLRQKNELHAVATTKLSDQQLDALALSVKCEFVTYQLIRKDCLAFAKRMATEIACNENGIKLEQVKSELDALTVYRTDQKSAPSEEKSRRYPNAPIGFMAALFGALAHDPAALKYPMAAVWGVSLSVIIYRRFL